MPKIVNCRRSQHGFTLVEILIFLLLIMALLMVLLSSTGALTKMRSTNLSGIATRIASCEIEKLRGLDYSVLPSADGVPTAIGASCNADLAKLPPPSAANRTMTDYTGDSNIKQIKIDVTWTEAGVTESVQVITLRSKYGI